MQLRYSCQTSGSYSSLCRDPEGKLQGLRVELGKELDRNASYPMKLLHGSQLISYLLETNSSMQDSGLLALAKARRYSVVTTIFRGRIWRNSSHKTMGYLKSETALDLSESLS